MQDLAHYIAAFSSLHTAKVRGVKAPHKAVLLLAVIDLVEEGSIASQRIALTDGLVQRFDRVWRRYVGCSEVFRPNIGQPFFHMQHEAFWRLVEHDEYEVLMVAEDSPHVEACKETKELPTGSYSVRAMREAFACAEMDGALFRVLQDGNARARLRVTLISNYF